jgi:tripartite-type tricarboxylate transporter receptor subunit TctC
MYENRRKALVAAFAGTVALMYPWASRSADPQQWPARPITMVVPFPPAGPTDIIARLLAKQLSDRLGQTVVVQNMPGANGIVGMRNVVRSEPDGYTILYNTSSLVLSPNLYLDAGFDPVKDFDAVSSTAAIPLVLLTHPSVPASDFPSFVSYVRQLAGNLSYASAGAGNVTHLTAVLLLQSMNIRAMHVPYRGSAPALTGLIAGETQFMLNPVSGSLGHIRDGRLRALAVTSKERIAALPDVPTVAESGSADFEARAWHGVVVPKGTPAPVIQQLNAAIRQALVSEEMQAQLSERGAQTLGATPDDYARYIQAENVRWGTVISKADIRPD